MWAVKPDHCLSPESGQCRAGGPFAQWHRDLAVMGEFLCLLHPLKASVGEDNSMCGSSFFPKLPF